VSAASTASLVLSRYGVPLLAASMALALTTTLIPLLHGVTFVPLLVAIVLTTRYGGAQGGILAPC